MQETGSVAGAGVGAGGSAPRAAWRGEAGKQKAHPALPRLSPRGVAAFAATHLLYLWAFGLTPLQPGLLLLVILAALPYYGLLLWHLPPDLVLALTAYSLALATMLWRGLARGGSTGWGALLFTLSDTMLAWNAFAQPLPHARLVVMTTYYSAQVLISLSVSQSPKLKPN